MRCRAANAIMTYRWLATLVVVGHALFVVFVLFGGVLVLRWPRVAWVHIPCAVWGMLVEYANWICPLTPIEDSLRQRAAEGGYSGGFLQHYVLKILYPNGLTRDVQIVLGTIVLVLTCAVYAVAIARWRQTRKRPARD